MSSKFNWKLYIPYVDVLVLVVGFIFGATLPLNNNLTLQRICYLIQGNEKSKCDMLGVKITNETKHLEKEAQYVNNQIQLINQCTEATLTVLVSLLIGPWTDKFGRKPGIILTTTGMTLTVIFGMIFAAFDLSPWFILVIGIPGMLTGGYNGHMTACTTYVMDITNEENRGMRMAVFQALSLGGMIAGTFLSSPLFNALGYVKVNIVFTAVALLIWFYVVFVLKESLKKVETKGIIAGFFDLSSPKQIFKATFQRRNGSNRGLILLVSLVTTLVYFTTQGDINLKTLFLRRKFSWTMQECNVYSGISTIVRIFGTIIGTFLLGKVLKFKTSVSCMIVFALMVAGSLETALATKDWEMYMVSGIRSFDDTFIPFKTILIANLIDSNEIGKVMAGMTGIQVICGLLAPPTYTAIYNATLEDNPAFYNYLSSTLYGLNVILMITIVIMEWRNSQRTPSDEKEHGCAEKEEAMKKV